MEFSKNPNKDIFDSLVGKTVASVEYSDLREGDDYVSIKFTDETVVKFHAKAPRENDITWIKAEIKRA